MSNVAGPMPASFIVDQVKYLNDRGCDVIQIHNSGGYWQSVIYNQPQNINKWFHSAINAEMYAIRNMTSAIDKAIKGELTWDKGNSKWVSV
jgi:ferritin-like protein